jgi:D-glycero-D-manno-heptose 1,7-bisphosphate phosphatase
VEKRPALFVDRDDTLVRDKGYMHRPEDLVWMPGAIAAVKAANDAGWLVIVVTNQSGIGRGLFSEAHMHGFHAAMQADLAAHGARIDAWYFCPFHADATIPEYRVADHPDRKPNPGMILRALADLPIEASRSVMIGNSRDDVDAGRRAELTAFQVGDGEIEGLVARLLADGS